MRSTSNQYRANSPKQYFDVKREAAVLDVGNVEPEPCIELAFAAPINLPKPGESWNYIKALSLPEYIGIGSK